MSPSDGTLHTLFAQSYDGDPDVVASSAGRVNLIGEHVDYNGGQVLPIAIEKRTCVAVRASSAGESRVISEVPPGICEFDARHPRKSGRWFDYVAGVVEALRRAGIDVPQFDLAVTSDVPRAAGLSSSAALEVAAALALATLCRARLTLRDLALAAWQAENQFVGVPCGIMDQFASALGETDHALHLWCDSEETEQVPFRESILIFDTGVSRSLRSSDFAQRRAECEEALRLLRLRDPSLRDLAAATPDEVRAARLPEPLNRRALHVSEETRRVERAVEALKRSGTIPGELLVESHESLRTLYECSSPELDWFVNKAMGINGIHGARLTGAGWGGCAIAVGERDALERAAAELPGEYSEQFGHEARTWLTSAAQGAHTGS